MSRLRRLRRPRLVCPAYGVSDGHLWIKSWCRWRNSPRSDLARSRRVKSGSSAAGRYPAEDLGPQPGGVPAPVPVVPAAPPNRPAIQVAPALVDRFTSARANFSHFARSGGGDRAGMGRALSGYVSKASGGARQATRRMGSSRAVGAGILNFLSDAQTRGVRQALRALDLEALAGRPVQEVFLGLADYLCPEGGSVDEGIARDAFIETIGDIATLGLDLEALTPVQVHMVFEIYATHAIEARIINDIGSKAVSLPADVQAVEQVQAQLRDIIRRGVSDAFADALASVNTIPADRIMEFVTSVYELAFSVLQTLAEAEEAA